MGLFSFSITKSQANSFSALISIDEIDAIAATRIDVGTSGEREVQRTFMQLLAEIDGFKPLDNVKIIGCTNRRDILDTAILRPGRLDRRIYVPLPDDVARKEIFKIHTKNVSMNKVNVNEINIALDGLSGAEIKAVVTEAGYFAIRESRTKVTEDDFFQALDKVRTGEPVDENDTNYMG